MVVLDNQRAPEAWSVAMELSSMWEFHHGYVLVEKMNVAHKMVDVMGRRISLSKSMS
jgi:hypothetical protein